MAFSLGLATFLIPKPQPNRANTYFFEPKPCVLQCVVVCFSTMFVFLKPPRRSVRPPGRPRGSRGASRRSWGAQLGPPWGPAGPPGVLLERSWRLLRRSRGALDAWRLLAAPRALPGALLAVSWRSLEAFWSPGTSFSSLFSLRKGFLFWRSAPPQPKPQPPLGL